MICLLVLIGVVSLQSCTSFAKIHYLDDGRVDRIVYSNNQEFSIEQKDTKVSGNNKFNPLDGLMTLNGIGR